MFTRPARVRQILRSAFILALLVVMPAHAGGGAPQIGSLSETILPRSGRLLISGSSFGAEPGTVTIDGLDAIVTKWFDDEIHAYVPEATPLGAAPVQVTTAGGSSNSVALEVTLRQRDGRKQWRFQVASGDVGFGDLLILLANWG